MAPQNPTFLNTKDIGSNENCIAGKEYREVDVQCAVKSGTSPVFVRIYITEDDIIQECTFDEEHVTVLCEKRLWLQNAYHLRKIRCEVSNEATVSPIATTAKFYVIRKYRLI